MKKLLLPFFVFYILTGCNNTEKTPEMSQENSEEVAPSLSVEEVEALMKASNPNEKIYKGTLSFGNVKNIEFSCDSGKLLTISLELPNEGLEMNTYKKTKVTKFVDAEKTMDFQEYILMSSGLSFSEKPKKTTNYKIEIKPLNTIIDSNFVIPYTLKSSIE